MDVEMPDSASKTVRVASLGLFILDTFEWRTPDGQELQKLSRDVIGGGGTYCIVGSRMWLPPKEIGIVVDRGNDFGAEVQKELDAFGEMWHYRDVDRPTTRALNLYTGEHRDFKYLSERTRLEPIDFPSSLRTSNYLHCVCSPTRVIEIHSQLLPPLNTTPTWLPSLVYEPIPDRCIPAELPALIKIINSIPVFSPNHEEAFAFFGVPPEEVKKRGRKGIEDVAQRFLDIGAGRDVVVRSGEWGAYCIRRGGKGGTWVDAYHQDREKVVDVTGAGNTFLGGLMAGLELYPKDLILATQMGAVSASFTIEQFGLPKLLLSSTGEELWNGSSPAKRLEELQARPPRSATPPPA